MTNVGRREFIALLGGAAATWPRAAGAQQQAIPVVGFLGSTSSAGYAHLLPAFREGLNETGFSEGQNVAIEYRWSEGECDRLRVMAAELIRRPVAVIVALALPAIRAATAATTTIPVVFATGAGPVEIGLVASLSRPGGNLTGVTNLNVEVGVKRLELLHELVPAATIVALLVNPNNPNATTLTRRVQAAAGTLGLTLHVVQASAERDFAPAFATAAQARAGGLVIGTDAFFRSRSEQLAGLALRHALPAIYQDRPFIAAGGLVSYGGSITDQYRQIGIYTGRILKGEKPGDLPVQQSTKVELIVNLKTAKALGITIPTALLVRADEVIE